MTQLVVYISIPMESDKGLYRQTEACEREWSRICIQLEKLLGFLDLSTTDILVVPTRDKFETLTSSKVENVGKRLQDMSKADIVVFSPSWSNSPVCRIEHSVCISYDIPYIITRERNGRYYLVKKGETCSALPEAIR